MSQESQYSEIYVLNFFNFSHNYDKFRNVNRPTNWIKPRETSTESSHKEIESHQLLLRTPITWTQTETLCYNHTATSYKANGFSIERFSLYSFPLFLDKFLHLIVLSLLFCLRFEHWMVIFSHARDAVAVRVSFFFDE